MALLADIFLQFFRLGLVSFGGPAAHLVKFERHFVVEKAWISVPQYQQLVALCQFLPGPASSQVGIGIGLQRGGIGGALAAFAGFTLPSFVLMTLAGIYGLQWLGTGAQQGALCALAVIVLHAIWQMSHSLLPDWTRRSLALLAFGCFLLWFTPGLQLAILFVFGLVGAVWLRPALAAPQSLQTGRPRFGLLLLAMFLLLFAAFPWLAQQFGETAPLLVLADAGYQTGALVFGGGHVVLPLLEQQRLAVLSQTDFLAGYAFAQLMPGPLFSFAAYFGSASGFGTIGAVVATVALFLPGGLLICAIWPWWPRLSQNSSLLGAVAAVNCAVVGLLAAAWWQFILPHGVVVLWHWFALCAGFAMVWRGRCSPVLLLPLYAVLGWGVSWF